MKNKFTLFILAVMLSSISAVFAQTPNSYANAWTNKKGVLTVQYLNNYPYAYMDNGEITGIEIDIIKRFAKWLKDKKGIEIELQFEGNDDFAKFYEKVKSSKSNYMGAGSVAVTTERAREIKFSSPYLKNKLVLVSTLLKPTLTDIRNISKEFAGMTAVIVKGSVHEKMIKSLKDNYWPALQVEFVESPAVVLDKLSTSDKYFGYLDLITYWSSIQKETKPLKLHRTNLTDTEYFGFIFAKSTDWSVAFNEFFDSGLGFPGTTAYLDILKKHLSPEIINAVAIQY